MTELMTNQNVEGFFKFLITMGIVDDNIMDIDFFISQMAQKAIKLNPSLDHVLNAFLAIIPAFATQNQRNSNYKGLSKTVLFEYLKV